MMPGGTCRSDGVGITQMVDVMAPPELGTSKSRHYLVALDAFHGLMVRETTDCSRALLLRYR